ncbi:MAG: oligosaccharide flippase family protein [Candidatus Acidiferrales bacterium]
MLKLISKNALARNTAWMSVGQGLRLAIRAAYFIVIIRSLGVSNYGAFVGVVALVGILSPFGALGSGALLIKNVSRDKRLFASTWGMALITLAVSSSLLIGVVLPISRFALPAVIPLRLVLLIAVSDILGLNLIGVAGQAFQAFEQLEWTATINVLISAGRLAGGILLVLIQRHPSALQWGYVYCGTTLAVAITAYRLVTTKLGPPVLSFVRSLAEIREGFYFSVSLSAQTIYNDIDKTMLARLSTLSATGIYGAAYRLIDVSFAPVSALLAAAYPNFFRRGVAGVSSTLAYARQLLKHALGYSSLICAGILLCAGAVPYILGPEYARTAEALRWLAPLPILKALHYFLSDTLTGAGYQGLRSALQTMVALFNVLINLWLIPAYSWRGAAWSSIASDGLLACAVGIAVFILTSRESRQVELAGMAPKVTTG